MKVLAIVQARMGSERLPGKVVKHILNKPLILYTLERLSKSKLTDEIVLATSTKDSEEPLVNIVKKEGYKVFRGDEDNVLERYKKASDKYLGDIIIRVTGDCPLIDPVIVDNVVTYFKMYNYDYVRLDVPDSFIRGFDVEVFSKKALDKTYNIVNTSIEKEDNYDYKSYREHVTLYMYNHPEKFKIGRIKGEEFYNKDYRLCVDTEEDFKLVENIYNYFKNSLVSSREIIKYIDDNKEIIKVNKDVNQRI
jgi:spore coat polysaccharide biosynthesis protein SpsF